MRKENLSTPIRLATAVAFTVSTVGCTKSMTTPTVEQGKTPITSQIDLAILAELRALNTQLAAQVEKPTLTATSIASATKEVEKPQCPPAADLGPWAPVEGKGQTFEVTCNEEVCTGTHVQLWWPRGSKQDWGKKEISVLVPAGLSIEVQKGAGRGWEYPLDCSQEEIEAQMEADHLRRDKDTNYWGVVDIDYLIETGLVVVRFDRR